MNVKGILYSFATLSTFILPHYGGDPFLLTLISLALAAMCIVSTLSWSLFGVVFQAYFSRYETTVNVVMALLLVYCAASLSGLDVKALF